MSLQKTGIAGTHLVRYGIPADQRYLLGPFLPTYDQLVVNANILAHTPLSISGFLSQHAKKPYIVDPKTHAFQHGYEFLVSESKASSGKIKSSWAKLIESYGDPFKKAVIDGKRSVEPKDFRSSALMSSLCARVREFQLSTVTGQLSEKKDAKYLKFVSKLKGVDLTNYPPSLLIAPYFYLEENSYEEWLAVNIECLNAFIAGQTKKIPVAAEIVLPRSLMVEKAASAKILAAYQGATKPDVFLIWVDDFSEHSAGVTGLVAWCEFIKQLSQLAPVVNLNGGYLSTLLALHVCRDKMIGVCHGPGYGEMRQVVPVGGGVPVAKFYLPALHHRLSPLTAVEAIKALDGMTDAATYFANVCDCQQCKKVVEKDPKHDLAAYFGSKASSYWSRGRWTTRDFPTPEASDLCNKHYMYCKAREFGDKTDLPTVVTNLKRAGRRLGGALGAVAAHTGTWPKFLAEIGAL